jgi:hypothetical protein
VTFDLLRRIRWTNVARAAAVALALLLALAWPRLRTHQDALPPAVEPVPAALAKVPAAVKAARLAQPGRVRKARVSGEETPAHRARTKVVPERQAAKRRAARRHRHARHRRPRITVPAATPTPVYVAPPAVSASAAEFRP